jgi:integrase
MATLLLTDKAISGAKPKAGERVELWDTHTKGLCLRISGKTRVWLVRYRANGKQRRFVIGDYPDTGIADARIAAAPILRDAKRDGTDPAGERLRKRAELKARTIKDFNDLADAFLEACRNGEWRPRGKPQRPRTIKDAEECLDRYVRPEIGDMAVGEITRATIRDLKRKMAARGIKAQTNKTVGVIRRVFAFAIDEWDGQLVAANPATGHAKEHEAPKTRVLSDDELAIFWAALNDPSGLRLPPGEGENEGKRVYLSRQMAILFQLAILLLNRRVELSGAMGSELNVDQAIWVVTADRMKNGRPHLVPLPPKALELFNEALALAQSAQAALPADDPRRGANDFPLFPSPRDASKPIRPGTVTHAMTPVIRALGLKSASPHDLRRTGSTALTSERIGVSHFIRSQVISHTSDSGGGAAVSSRHYDVNTYAAEKRRALQAWEDLLLEIVGERARPSNVSAMRGAA